MLSNEADLFFFNAVNSRIFCDLEKTKGRFLEIMKSQQQDHWSALACEVAAGLVSSLNNDRKTQRSFCLDWSTVTCADQSDGRWCNQPILEKVVFYVQNHLNGTVCRFWWHLVVTLQIILNIIFHFCPEIPLNPPYCSFKSVAIIINKTNKRKQTFRFHVITIDYLVILRVQSPFSWD